MSLNDTDMHPTKSEAVYPGVANPTPSNANVITDIPSGSLGDDASVAQTEAAKKDVIEAKPGLIESTDLAPLGDEKVAADPGLVSQATALGKKAYEAVLGSK